jgi:sarcosine oxidase
VPARSHRDTTEWHQCIVVGAGLLGLSAAYSLTRRGTEVLVLDPDVPGHDRSGSKGTARIFRLGYPDPLYARLAADALGWWRRLEEEGGRPLLRPTSQVTLGNQIDAIAAALSEVGAPFTRLTQRATADRFPDLRVDGPSLVEEGSGVLMADECLGVLRDTGSFEIRTSGVRALHDRADGVTVVLTDEDTLSADVVVDCAGPNAIALVPGLRCPAARPPSLQQVAYFALPDTGSAPPIFIEWGDDMVYGLPVIGQDVYKVSHHTPGPDLSDDHQPFEDDAALLKLLTTAVARLLPRLNPVPVATERCLYDNTVDADFMLARTGHIVLGCGTSGHGFKFGPLLGELLADLAGGISPPVDLTRFALSRSPRRAFPNP